MESPPFIDSVSDGWLGLGEKSKTLKRRLRRERIAMEKQGDFIPFNLQVTKLQPEPQPKLTNSGKRAARKRRKLALEEEPSTEPDIVDRSTSFINGECQGLENRNKSKLVSFSESLPCGEVDPANTCVKNESGNLDDELPRDLQKLPSENLKLAKSSANGEKKDAPPRKKRYVLFVGNLSFETKEEDVMEHFKKIGVIKSVRLAKHKGSNACRGFCHLEVGDEETYLKALSLHHTFMAKRRINVEYSSGQAEERGELKRKNFKLHHLNKTGQIGGSKSGWRNSTKPKVKAVPGEPMKEAFFV